MKVVRKQRWGRPAAARRFRHGGRTCHGRWPIERWNEEAFTLLEVMIALAIFFMTIFVILQSTSQSLSTARLLQQRETMPDLGILIGDLSLTNRIEEGIVEGDFGDLYPGATWIRESNLVATNGLMQVDFTIRWLNGKKPMESKSSMLLWSPNSLAATMGGVRR